jgi:hypothetical protein
MLRFTFWDMLVCMSRWVTDTRVTAVRGAVGRSSHERICHGLFRRRPNTRGEVLQCDAQRQHLGGSILSQCLSNIRRMSMFARTCASRVSLKHSHHRVSSVSGPHLTKQSEISTHVCLSSSHQGSHACVQAIASAQKQDLLLKVIMSSSSAGVAGKPLDPLP